MTLSISEYRDHASRWLRWACGPGSGYAESHVIYQRVTEGRDKAPWPNKYSSCGDLAHGLYEQLGVRLPWVNRAALGQYRERKNITLLAYAPVARAAKQGERFEAGDVLIVWDHADTSDAHAITVLDEFPEQGVILTAEYGQPGAAVRTSGIERDKNGVRIRNRTVRRVLSLESVLEAAEDAGLLVPVDHEGNPLPTGDAS